ncbi:hypothetical protein QFC20_002203 [Naganishia adeliensis]|uniref:Uncharacterized protein n=1 Tax=Naganishia adeliensis TaxID=92952 RepID=A0ACC2WM52_9TREE|nr:hypothetical protein QFC20_002203 [Naganishia adeliensis]
MSTASAPPKFHPRSASAGARPASQLAKHGKYVLLGVVGCWYYDLLRLVQDELLASRSRSGRSSGARGYKMMVTSLSLQAITIGTELHV